jgi:hypothetical protein
MRSSLRLSLTSVLSKLQGELLITDCIECLFKGARGRIPSLLVTSVQESTLLSAACT